MGEVKVLDGDQFWLTKADGVCCPGWWVWAEAGRCFCHATQPVDEVSVKQLKESLVQNSIWLREGRGAEMAPCIHNYEYMAEQLIAEGSL